MRRSYGSCRPSQIQCKAERGRAFCTKRRAFDLEGGNRMMDLWARLDCRWCRSVRFHPGWNMRRVTRFASRWDAEGFSALLNAGSGVALPGNSYLVTDEQIAALRAKGIPFDEVATRNRQTSSSSRRTPGLSLGVNLAGASPPNRPVASGVGAVARFCRHHGKRKACEKALPQGGVLPERRATPWGSVGGTGLSPERAY